MCRVLFQPISNELIIKCAIVGLEQKSAHQVDQWSKVGHRWYGVILLTLNDALVIIAYLLLLNYLLFRLRCLILTYIRDSLFVHFVVKCLNLFC